MLREPFSLSFFPSPVLSSHVSIYVPILVFEARARRAGIRLGQLQYLQHFNRPMLMEPGRIQAAARAHAEQALAKKRQFSSMRAFLVGLLSFTSLLFPLHAPTVGFPTLNGQPDLLASDLHYVQSAPGCPLIFYGLNPVGICNIGVYEGQLVLKLKDVVSTACVWTVFGLCYTCLLTCLRFSGYRALPCAPTLTPTILLLLFPMTC